QVEEGLKVLEPVRVAQRLGAGEGQGEAVAGGEAEDQLGFERAFDVQVQFGFRYGHRSIVRPGARGPVSGAWGAALAAGRGPRSVRGRGRRAGPAGRRRRARSSAG